MAQKEEVYSAKDGKQRMKGVSISLPVVTGSIAFYLGKKATEHASHRWTCYIRSATGEDMSHIIKKVQFGLHSSFPNANRMVEYAPFELTEVGWGEFNIAVTVFFHDDCGTESVELTQHLALYDSSGGNNAKRPIASEVFDEIVFYEPTEAFYRRIMGHEPTPAPPSQLAQFHSQYNPQYDYRRIQHARQRVAQITANISAQLASTDAATAEFT